MRTLVIALAVLAGLKLWTHQTLYRAASEQALMKAYGEQAEAACQRKSQRRLQKTKAGRNPQVWSLGSSAKVVIGDHTLNVSLWQVDHELWERRFKTPFIQLKTSADSRALCVFNVMTGSAHISRV